MLSTLPRITPPLKTHGGKWYLAPKIIPLMPPHTHYVEPFAGGLSVLLAKDPEGVSEVANDIHRDLTTFWRVLQKPKSFARMQRILEATPFSEVEHQEAGLPSPDPVERATQFFIRCRQSLAGRMEDFAPLSRTRTRGGRNEQANAWVNAIDGLPAVHARLRGVVILNHDGLEVIREQDGPDTLFYLDPPYLAETRASKKVYAHEMDPRQHRELLETIRGCKGRVMLSGYHSELYDRELRDWTCYEFGVANHAAGGEEKRRMVEVVWCNF